MNQSDDTDMQGTSAHKRRVCGREPLSNILFLGILLISILGLSLSLWYFGDKAYRETEHTIPEKSMEAYIAEQRAIVRSLDNLQAKKARNQESRDSIVEIVRCSQLMLLRQQEILVDDVRQEVNNHINKVNTWLAYALSLMAVVGVFLPLALQFRLQQQDKERFKEQWDDQNKRFEQQQQEFDLLKAKFEQEIGLSSLASHYNAFNVGVDTEVLAKHGNREQLFRGIWNATLASFSTLVDDCFRKTIDSKVDTLNPRSRMLMVEGLIKIYGMLNKMKNHRGPTRHREIWRVGDTIHKLILKIDHAADTELAYNDIYQSLKSLVKDLHNLSIELPLSR